MSKKPTKIKLITKNIIQILALQKHLDRLMLIISNRCQGITFSDIKDHQEKISKTAVNEEIFLALFSVDQQSYKFYETHKTIFVLNVKTQTYYSKNFSRIQSFQR